MAPGDTQGGGGSNQGGSGGSQGGGKSGSNNPPLKPAAEFPLHGIILIVLAAIILIIVVIILIVYIRRRRRRQTGDVEKNKGKQTKKEKHGGKGHRHAKPNEKSKIVNPVTKGEGKKKTVREEKLVHNQPPPEKRVAREKSLPAAPQVKKSVRAAQPAPVPSDDAYIDMTQQSTKQPNPLPTYDNRPSNQHVYDDLEPVDSYEALQSEYLQPTPHGRDMYQSLEGSDNHDYVNEETGSYLELHPPGYEDPVTSSQLTAHYTDFK